jgi:hypothetical protein
LEPHEVKTVAGTGVPGQIKDDIGTSAQFDGIRGLTCLSGIVYLLDPNASVLRSFDPITGQVKTIAGGAYQVGYLDGPGTTARFNSPRYMTTDGSDKLFIADTNGNAIRIYNTESGEVSTFAGNGTCGYADGIGTNARVHRPRGITFDGTSLYWVENDAHTIRQGIASNHVVGTISGTNPACTNDCSCGGPTPMGSYLEGTGTQARWNFPFGIAFHPPTRSLFVSDGGNHVIRRIK